MCLVLVISALEATRSAYQSALRPPVAAVSCWWPSITGQLLLGSCPFAVTRSARCRRHRCLAPHSRFWVCPLTAADLYARRTPRTCSPRRQVRCSGPASRPPVPLDSRCCLPRSLLCRLLPRLSLPVVSLLPYARCDQPSSAQQSTHPHHLASPACCYSDVLTSARPALCPDISYDINSCDTTTPL